MKRGIADMSFDGHSNKTLFEAEKTPCGLFDLLGERKYVEYLRFRYKYEDPQLVEDLIRVSLKIMENKKTKKRKNTAECVSVTQARPKDSFGIIRNHSAFF